jgi:carbon starvation protein CstA
MKNLPYILVVIYLILVVISVIPIFMDREALSGVFAAGLTMPWSSLLGNLMSGSGKIIGLVIIAVSALINAAIIGAVARWLVSKF